MIVGVSSLKSVSSLKVLGKSCISIFCCSALSNSLLLPDMVLISHFCSFLYIDAMREYFSSEIPAYEKNAEIYGNKAERAWIYKQNSACISGLNL